MLDKTAMKVSVVTPSFDQGEYIRNCIDSIRNQTYRPIEHIIIDNCSTDQTGEILKEYKRNSNDVEVKIMVEPDKGQSDALNKGFKLASGNLIAWLNADDYFLPGAFHKAIQEYIKNHEIDVFYGDYYFVDEKGNISKKRKEIGYDTGILFYVGCYIPSTGSFFNKRIFDEGFFLHTDFDITMDYEFFVRLSEAKKKFLHLPEYLFCFRWHQKNKSLNITKRRKEREKVQQMHGIKLFHSPEWNQKFYNIMLYPYLVKRIFKKFLTRCYF